MYMYLGILGFLKYIYKMLYMYNDVEKETLDVTRLSYTNTIN